MLEEGSFWNDSEWEWDLSEKYQMCFPTHAIQILTVIVYIEF